MDELVLGPRTATWGSLEDLHNALPLEHPDIKRFYEQHKGDKLDFIQTRPHFRAYHDAIYFLLRYLDEHGDTEFYFDCKPHEAFNGDQKSDNPKTRVRNFALSAASNMVSLCRKSGAGQGDSWPNLQMLKGGIAALSYNVCLGLGNEYCKHFKDFGQASIAIIERIPAVKILSCFSQIEEIVRLFYTYMHPSMDYNRYRLLEQGSRDSSNLDIVRLLIQAETQVRRKEIFRYTKAPGSFALGGISRKKAEAAAYRIAQTAENERQHEESDQDKKNSELATLRKRRTQDRKEIKILKEIVRFMDLGQIEAAERSKRRLRNLSAEKEDGLEGEPKGSE